MLRKIPLVFFLLYTIISTLFSQDFLYEKWAKITIDTSLRFQYLYKIDSNNVVFINSQDYDVALIKDKNNFVFEKNMVDLNSQIGNMALCQCLKGIRFQTQKGEIVAMIPNIITVRISTFTGHGYLIFINQSREYFAFQVEHGKYNKLEFKQTEKDSLEYVFNGKIENSNLIMNKIDFNILPLNIKGKLKVKSQPFISVLNKKEEKVIQHDEEVEFNCTHFAEF